MENPLSKSFNTIALIKFAFPSMVMMLFMGLYTITDTIFVARFVDSNALSSINIVCPVINIIVGLGTMLGAGGSAVIAKKMGSGNIDEARSNFTLIIITGIITGLVITIIGLLFLDKIIWGLGASKTLFPYCKDYLEIQLILAVLDIMQVLYQNLFVTAGRPGLGLILSVFAGIANIFFDYIFIVCLRMGVMGAALGTGTGYMIPAITGTIFFLAGRKGLHFCKPKMDTHVLIKSCSNGMSEMISQLSAAMATFLFNITMMKLVGEDGVAAITVIIYSGFLLTSIYIGFSMGVAPVISYNYGAGNITQLKKVLHICFCFIISISISVFLFSLFNGKNIAKLFAANNKNVYEITKTGFTIYSFSFLFSGCNIFTSALFTALSNGKLSAIISFLRTFGFIVVLLLILPEFLKITGVWLAVPVAELLTFVLAVCLIHRYNKQYNYL
jgi:Na+-driven multidrug efflux pump